MQAHTIQQTLESIILGDTDITLQALRAITRLEIIQGRLTIDLTLGLPLSRVKLSLTAMIEEKLAALGVKQWTIHWRQKILSHRVPANLPAVPGIKNIVAIASGKGGVGKSTTAVNLALALMLQGATVGILDADIYGPNQPHMLGVAQKPVLSPEKKFLPVMAHGLQTMSIGYLIQPNTPMIWRGPMVTQALKQLLFDTLWHDLDYLLVDMPPGTGDIQLTLAKNVPVTGAVIVTTPQDIALLDARKGLEMFCKVGVPVLGVIENMSVYVCPHCGKQEPLFGASGAQKLGHDCAVPLLGQVPLQRDIRVALDQGKPPVIAEPQSSIASLYHDIALNMAIHLARQEVNYAVKFPKIVVE